MRGVEAARRARLVVTRRTNHRGTEVTEEGHRGVVKRCADLRNGAPLEPSLLKSWKTPSLATESSVLIAL
jgi:hypothetical protein